jgi:hypothetical protein
MATYKFISTYYAGGYSIAANTNLYITGTGGIGGAGLSSVFNTTITNDGRISGSLEIDGVRLYAGGRLTNGSSTYTNALIRGQFGVLALNAPVSVTNYGTIQGVHAGFTAGDGLYLGDGGGLVNGGTEDRTALVEGTAGVVINGASGAVANFGTILAQGSGGYDAVFVGAGGVVTNGSVADVTARIEGGVGVNLVGAGGVANFGTIVGSVNQGVVLYGGGNVTNGAASDAGASIDGVHQGVGLVFSGMVTNFGTIFGSGVYNGATGVQMNSGGRLVNGTVRDVGASIAGYTGVLLGGPGTVTNYGAIDGLGASGAQYGVDLADGGTVINGVGTDRTASIEGGGGVVFNSAPGTLENSGAIVGAANTWGASLGDGGVVVNGSFNNSTALIQGYSGLFLYDGLAMNYGTISAVSNNGPAVRIGSASITNGAAGQSGALIEGGLYGVFAPVEAVTVTNYGTIAGAVAVVFGSSADVLNVEAGSSFVGAVLGGGGTLDLASGVGTLTGLLSSGGNVTVSGSMTATTFQNFGTVEVGAGAKFTDKGAVTLAAGQVVNDAGTLTLGGAKAAVTNAGLLETTGSGVLTIAGVLANSGTLAVGGGTLTVKGAVTGKGVATIGGGTLDLVSSFTQNVTFTGTTGELELAQSQGYTGSIAGFSKTGGTSLDLVDIGFVNSGEATFSGATKSGVLTVTDGTHTAHITLEGNYTASTFIASSDGHGGTIVVDPKTKGAAAPIHPFIAAMAGLGASGSGVESGAPFRPDEPRMLLVPRSQMA